MDAFSRQQAELVSKTKPFPTFFKKTFTRLNQVQQYNFIYLHSPNILLTRSFKSITNNAKTRAQPGADVGTNHDLFLTRLCWSWCDAPLEHPLNSIFFWRNCKIQRVRRFSGLKLETKSRAGHGELWCRHLYCKHQRDASSNSSPSAHKCRMRGTSRSLWPENELEKTMNATQTQLSSTKGIMPSGKGRDKTMKSWSPPVS